MGQRSLIAEALTLGFAIDTFERTGEDSPGSNLIKHIDPHVDEGSQGLLPEDW